MKRIFLTIALLVGLSPFAWAQSQPVSGSSSVSIVGVPHVIIDQGGGGSIADGTTFTPSTTAAVPISAFYQSSVSNCADGKVCGVGMTIDRALKVSVVNLTTDSPDNQPVTEAPILNGGEYIASPLDHTDGDKAVLLTDIKGRLIIVDAPVTLGGLTNSSIAVAASDNHTNIKNGAGQVYAISGFSIHTAAQFVRLYNAASGFNGCNSATNLIWRGIIPGASTGAGFTGVTFPGGLAFSTGISACVTGAIGDTDTTNATASVAELNVSYK